MRRTNAVYGAFMTASLLALDGTDHQLLRTAATMMPAPTEADRDKAASVLLAALSRLTALATDTSRDARVAIVQRLAAVLPPPAAPSSPATRATTIRACGRRPWRRSRSFSARCPPSYRGRSTATRCSQRI